MSVRPITKIKSIVCIAAAVFVLAGIAAAQGQPTKKQRRQAEDLWKAGDKSFQQKNYRNAIDQYAQSVAIVAENADVHAKKANAHFLLQEYDRAAAEATTALGQRFSKPIELYKMRALARYELHDLDGALADISEVLKAEPANTMFILKQADISSEKGNDRDALSAYQKAVAADSRNGDLYYKIGSIQMKMNETDGQIAASQEAIKYGTQYLGDAWYIIADGYYKKRQYDPAEQAYVKAIERFKATNTIKPDLYQSYRNLGDIYRRLNRFSDAVRITRQGIEAYPKDGLLWTDLSWYHSLDDNNKQAVDAARTAISFTPKNYLPYTNLCRALNETGEYQLAVNTCNQALRMQPDDGETYFYLGRAYDLLGNAAEDANRRAEATRYKRDATNSYDKAVVGLEKFTRENADYSDGFYLLGNAYFADGQTEKAIAAYQKCLSLSPRFVKARYNLGYAYAVNKNKAAAMEQYSSLLSLDQAYAAKLKAEIDKLQ